MTLDEILKIENPTQKVIALHQLCSQHYKNWTETEKLINAVLELESQVMNGGFAQYFQNTNKEEWESAFSGLEKIGATKSKDLLEKARASYWDNKLDLLEELDQEFFKYEDNIGALVIAYAENHKEDFGQ